MSKNKENIWFAKLWILGLIIFLPLASACFYTAWSLHDDRSFQTIIPVVLIAFILSAAGTMLLIFVNRIPSLVQEQVSEKTAALDKSEQRNRSIVNALPDLVFIVDREGRYIDFNTPKKIPVIVDPGHFIMRKVADVLPGPLATEAMTYIEKVLLTGEMLSHNYRMEVGGATRSYESRYIRHSNNDVMVLVRDTTTDIIAEQQSRENENKYRVLVEQATDSIVVANFQGNFLVVNPAGSKMSQYTEDELLKMRFHDLAVADELRLKPFKLAEVASGKTVTSERKMRRKDGEMVDVEIAARIIAPNRILAFIREISERKKVENELLKSRESLRRLTNYIETIREGERLHTAKEIHDELGQQLAVLKMDILKLGKKINVTDEDFAPDMNQLMETINGLIETVRKIVSDLRPGILDDIGLIATLDWYCGDFSKKTGIRTSFISDVTDDKFPQKLSITVFRIFQESLANVVKHSQADKADVSLLFRNKRLVVIIEDNGKGFDPSMLQQDKTPGIQALKERALMVQGSYTISSIPGRGTIVELVIPLDEL